MASKKKISVEDFVINGYYKVVLSNKKRFTGKCIKKNPLKRSIYFDYGEDELPDGKTTRKLVYMLHEDDVASAKRLSQRYIENIYNKGKDGTLRVRYKGLFEYGEV